MNAFTPSSVRPTDAIEHEPQHQGNTKALDEHPLRPLARLIARLIAEGDLTLHCESDTLEHQEPGG